MSTEPSDPRYFFEEKDAGRLRYSQRQWPTLGAALVLLGVLLLLTALGAVGGGATGALAGLFGGAAVLLALAGSGLVERHRVYDRALVLGPTWPGATPYVVPLESIDLATVRLWSRANLYTRSQPTPTASARRNAIYTTMAITFDGLAPVAANAKTRPRAMDIVARVTGAGATEAGGRPTDTWFLGTRSPEPLLRAVEAALSDLGHAEALGLADRVLAAHTVCPFSRSG